MDNNTSVHTFVRGLIGKQVDLDISGEWLEGKLINADGGFFLLEVLGAGVAVNQRHVVSIAEAKGEEEASE